MARAKKFDKCGLCDRMYRVADGCQDAECLRRRAKLASEVDGWRGNYTGEPRGALIGDFSHDTGGGRRVIRNSRGLT